MKPSKILFSIIFALIFTANIKTLTAQNIYANIGSGYGLNAASSTFGENYTTSISQQTRNTVKGSFGKGFCFGAGFGYMFNENFGTELGFNYLVGSKIDIKTSRTSDNPLSTTDMIDSYKASMLRIMPGIKITIGKNIKPYAKFGLVLGTFGKMTNNYSESINPPSPPIDSLINYRNSTIKYSKDFAFGFYGAFGIEFHLNSNMSLYAELLSINQSWAPGYSVMTIKNENGIDQLPSMSICDKETDYVKSITGNYITDVNSPSKAIKQYYPMSSFAINIGLHIFFGK
jgi:opacity protein-like surface antigen